MADKVCFKGIEEICYTYSIQEIHTQKRYSKANNVKIIMDGLKMDKRLLTAPNLERKQSPEVVLLQAANVSSRKESKLQATSGLLGSQVQLSMQLL